MMTFRDYKKTNLYQQASDVTLVINGTEEIDEMCYPEALDYLEVTFHGLNMDGSIVIGLSCCNWESRYEPGWIAQSE